ncbi:MAG: cell division protein FtsQ/DivIB [Micropepsaceae bacterium]
MRQVKGRQRRAAARRPEPAPVESWMPRVSWRSPMLMGAIGFVTLAFGAGLVQGGHLGIGGPAMASASGDAWYPIEEILAAGHYHTRRKDLLAAIEVKPGDDMMDVDPDEVRARVESLDWIASAKVARLWPATLQVQVVEKEPYAIWQSKGVSWLIDRKGTRITKDGVGEFAGLPLVVGDGAPQHAAALVEILKRFPAIQRVVKASVRVGDRRWDLHLKNGIQVRLPEDGVEDALQRLTTLEAEQKIFERDIESVDLRLPDRLIIKPRGGAAQSVARGEST